MAKMSAEDNALAYSTYPGDSGDDEAYGIAIDSSGCACITGHTYSDALSLPLVNPIDKILGGTGDTWNL